MIHVRADALERPVESNELRYTSCRDCIIGYVTRVTALKAQIMDGEEASAHHMNAKEDLRKHNILTRVHEALNHPSDEGDA